jgi:hypothetical protein
MHVEQVNHQLRHIGDETRHEDAVGESQRSHLSLNLWTQRSIAGHEKVVPWITLGQLSEDPHEERMVLD